MIPQMRCFLLGEDGPLKLCSKYTCCICLQTYASESLLIMCPFIADASPENVMVWNMLLNAEFEQWEGIIESEFYGGEPKDVESFSQMLDGGLFVRICEILYLWGTLQTCQHRPFFGACVFVALVVPNEWPVGGCCGVHSESP